VRVHLYRILVLIFNSDLILILASTQSTTQSFAFLFISLITGINSLCTLFDHCDDTPTHDHFQHSVHWCRFSILRPLYWHVHTQIHLWPFVVLTPLD
jgi:hypothetical protein